ncbi:MAG: MFS transporter [Alphaproteobacteria bacterium]|nr:MFS transporter [Alphaproteobacteria bacterium]
MASSAPTAPQRLPASGWAWALFEAGRIPLVILISVYVFTPYIATVFVPDPVEGQAAVAEAGKWGGWIVALTAPLLGATLDRYGPRKPFLAAVTALLTATTATYWFAAPDGSGLTIGMVIAIAATNTVLYAYSELAQNSLLVRAAPGQEHRASGYALGLGNAISLAALVFVLFAFVLPATPLFGLDKSMHEPDRISGPIAAGLLALCSVWLFLVVPDAPHRGRSLPAAIVEGARDLRALVADAKGHRDAMLFLLARMIFADGKVAIILFSGVYAAGVFGWRTMELLTLGLITSVFSVIGGFMGASLDGRVGPKRALQLQLGAVILAQIGILGTRSGQVLYLPVSNAPVWDVPVFDTLPELVFLLLGFVNAAAVTAAYASSRTMVVRLVPAESAGRFFGLYALSGNLTYWLAPTLIEFATRRFGTQQAGFVPVIGLLLIGLAILGFVRGGERRADRAR